MNIFDVAKEAGVSITTVSRVTNKVSTVKEKNRIKVEAAIRKLGYVPDVVAQRLAGAKSNALGLVFPYFEDMFFSFYVTEVMKGVGLVAGRLKLDILLHVTYSHLKKHSRENMLSSSFFSTSSVAGVIFAEIKGFEKQFAEVVKRNIPCIGTEKTHKKYHPLANLSKR